MRNKAIDLEMLASKLDISPTMHKYAVDRYTGISDHLKQQQIEANIYPQGSFRTGTVVRPVKNDIEYDYDIDVVCELITDKTATTPEKVKNTVGDALKSSAVYEEKLLPEQDRCWTLQYAEVSNNVGLKLDVVPCVREEASKILILKQQGVEDIYAQQAIAITEIISNGVYRWHASNPKGYGDWFDAINRRFLLAGLRERKSKFLQENRAMFSAETTVDEVPDYYIRSSLQRSIQLLKRHRDIYYGRIAKGAELCPISAIITTLSAKIAAEASVTDLENLLSYIVSGLREYASLLQGVAPKQRYFGDVRNYIERRIQKWWIPNPVNPDDNYADTWTDETARAFFSWIGVVSTDLAEPTTINETRYFTGLKTSFGSDFIEKTLQASAATAPTIATPKIIIQPTKPWRA